MYNSLIQSVDSLGLTSTARNRREQRLQNEIESDYRKEQRREYQEKLKEDLKRQEEEFKEQVRMRKEAMREEFRLMPYKLRILQNEINIIKDLDNKINTRIKEELDKPYDSYLGHYHKMERDELLEVVEKNKQSSKYIIQDIRFNNLDNVLKEIAWRVVYLYILKDRKAHYKEQEVLPYMNLLLKRYVENYTEEEKIALKQKALDLEAQEAEEKKKKEAEKKAADEAARAKARAEAPRSHAAVGASNYYNILELDSTANDEDIRKAYRKMALKWHPDRNTGNEAKATEKFQAINHAYDVLIGSTSAGGYNKKTKIIRRKTKRKKQNKRKTKRKRKSIKRRYK